MRWPRTTMVEYSRDRETYRVGGWYLEDGTRCEVMLAGRWLPGVIQRNPIQPRQWRIEVPVDRSGGGFAASLILTAGMRIRPPRERAAEVALER